MDIFTKIVKDLTTHPDSSLEWLPQYLLNLNVQQSKALMFKEALVQMHSNKALTLQACRRLWDRNGFSASIGITVDAQCKDVFNGKRGVSEIGPVSRLVLATSSSEIKSGLRWVESGWDTES